jgi:hypothetical protein
VINQLHPYRQLRGNWVWGYDGFAMSNVWYTDILLKNSQIGISRNSAKSTPLLKLCEDYRERFQEEATGPNVPYNRTSLGLSKNNPENILNPDDFDPIH